MSALTAVAQQPIPNATPDSTTSAQTSDDGVVTVAVPDGWLASVGSIRLFGYLLPIYTMQTPDETRWLLNGVFFPSAYVVPNEQYDEGDMFMLHGTAVEARAFTPADDYALEYLPDAYISFDDCIDEPDADIRPGDVPKTDGITYDAVTVVWICESQDGFTSVAEYYVRLGRAEVIDVGDMWWVDAVVGVIAPQDEFELTRALLERTVDSITVDYELAMQNSVDAFVDYMPEMWANIGTLAGIYGNR
jgi:hypothetical protein